MGFLGSIGGFLGNALGGLFGGATQAVSNYVSSSKGLKDQYNYNSKLQAQTYKYNQALQLNAQKWSQKMASSAHQLQVADMRKAGLNPILSATGGSGASAPGATGGSVGSSSVGMPDYDLGEAVNTALSYRQQKNNDKMADSQTWLQRKQASLFGEQARNEAERYESIVQDRKNSIAVTASQIERNKKEGDAALINAAANAESSSANAYFNRHRALGYSRSESNSDSTNKGFDFKVFGSGTSMKDGFSRGYSRSWNW